MRRSGFLRKIISVLVLLCLCNSAFSISGWYWNKTNNTAGSDVRLRFTSTALPPRYPLTVLHKYRPFEQLGFYAIWWYTRSDETFVGGADYNGSHPWPPGGAGTTPHKWEVAHNGTDVTSTQNVIKDVWYPQATTVALDGSGNLNYIYYWATDSGTGSTYQVTAQTPAANLATCSCTATTNNSGGYILEYGASPWEKDVGGNIGQNDETAGGIVRHIQIYDTILSPADVVSELRNETNSAVTAVGARHLWYSNINPTSFEDITDKSGAGHNPAWANSLRPAFWEYNPKPPFFPFPLYFLRRR